MSLKDMVNKEEVINQHSNEQDTFDDLFEEVSKQYETTEEEIKELMEDE